MGQEVTSNRQHVRASVALTARFSEPSETRQHDGVCQNLSRSGMFLGTPRQSAPGTVLKVECESAESSGRIRVVARVMWVRAESSGAGRPAGMGLRFLSLEEGTERAIAELLERGDIVTSGRRGRSDPPERVEPPRPRLVAVATVHEVRDASRSEDVASSKAPSSNPPPAGKSGDTGALRQRWKQARKQTQRNFPVGPPPEDPASSRTATSPPPQPLAQPSKTDEASATRATEPEVQPAGPAAPAPAEAPAEPPSADASVEPPPDDGADDGPLGDPEWRSRRLAELIDAEAAAQRDHDGDAAKVPRSRLHAEEAVLVRGPRILQLSGPQLARIVVGLLVVAGGLLFVVARKDAATGAVPTETTIVRPAALAADTPAASTESSPASPPAALPPAALPRGLDVPTAAVEAAPQPASSRRSSSSSRARGARSGAAESTPAPQGEATPAASDDAAAASSPREAALACLKVGDSACAVRALEGSARTAGDWELLVESYRTLGNATTAAERMRQYLERFPDGTKRETYRRQLQYRSGGPAAPADPVPASEPATIPAAP